MNLDTAVIWLRVSLTTEQPTLTACWRGGHLVRIGADWLPRYLPRRPERSWLVEESADIMRILGFL